MSAISIQRYNILLTSQEKETILINVAPFVNGKEGKGINIRCESDQDTVKLRHRRRGP